MARLEGVMQTRNRALMIAAGALLLSWLLVWGGYALASHSRMTAEKMRDYMHSVDLATLSAEKRAKALRELAHKLNALSAEDRRQARMAEEWKRWFDQMTEAEKGDFIEATLPTGYKQMITAFEQMPEDRRKKTVETAIKRLREAQAQMAEGGGGAGGGGPMGGNGPPISEELQKKMVSTGLKTFYSQSSAQAKAELAPLLEELQRTMESGAAMRRR